MLYGVNCIYTAAHEAILPKALMLHDSLSIAQEAVHITKETAAHIAKQEQPRKQLILPSYYCQINDNSSFLRLFELLPGIEQGHTGLHTFK